MQILLIFAPYLTVYLLGWGLEASIDYLKLLFLILHTIWIPILTLYTVRKKCNVSLFWIIIFFLLLAPGVYLQYPTDPWQHYRGITSWEHHSTIGSNEVGHRFGYFFHWTFLHWAPLEWHRIVLSIIAATTQLVMLTQVHRFCFYLNRNETLSRIQTISMMILGGTLLFSFRYYALAPTMLALAAYFASLPIAMEAFNRRLKPLEWITLTFLLLFMGMNHFQEFLLFLVTTCAITLERFTRSWTSRRTFFVVLGFLIFSAIFGYGLYSYFPKWFHFIDHHRLTRFGTIHIFHPEYQYYQTIGLHGVIGMIMSVLIFKKNRRLAFMTLLPVVLFLTPWIPLIYAQFLPAGSPGYRILFAMPICLALTAGLYSKFSEHSKYPSIWTMTILLILSLPPMRPIFGRFLFQFYRPGYSQTMTHQIETARWIRDHLNNIPPECWVITDDATDFSVNTMLGRKVRGDRIYSFLLHHQIDGLSDLLRTINSAPSFCGLLLAKRALVATNSSTWVQRYSQHWFPSSTFIGRIQEAPRPTVEFLLNEGYRGTDVPPYYVYFPPEQFLLPKQTAWSTFGDSNLIEGSNGKFILLNLDPVDSTIISHLQNRHVPAIDMLYFTSVTSGRLKAFENFIQSELLISHVIQRTPTKSVCDKIGESDCAQFALEFSNLVQKNGSTLLRRPYNENFNLPIDDRHTLADYLYEADGERIAVLFTPGLRVGYIDRLGKTIRKLHLADRAVKHFDFKSIDILIFSKESASDPIALNEAILLFDPKVILTSGRFFQSLRPLVQKKGVRIYENRNWKISIDSNLGQFRIDPI